MQPFPKIQKLTNENGRVTMHTLQACESRHIHLRPTNEVEKLQTGHHGPVSDFSFRCQRCPILGLFTADVDIYLCVFEFSNIVRLNQHEG